MNGPYTREYLTEKIEDKRNELEKERFKEKDRIFQKYSKFFFGLFLRSWSKTLQKASQTNEWKEVTKTSYQEHELEETLSELNSYMITDIIDSKYLKRAYKDRKGHYYISNEIHRILFE